MASIKVGVKNKDFHFGMLRSGRLLNTIKRFIKVTTRLDSLWT
jgi:hypothetical protein